jgi:hypothetical protein
MAKNQVIVQFEATSMADFDRCRSIEDSLWQAFKQSSGDGVVDGHDFGEGKFNIFIFPRAWGSALERVKAFLELRGALDDAIIAKFHARTDRYEVVHPPDYSGRFSL